MRTTFSGVYIALRALQAQQVSLDITGHNVANANNPNYSRQTALHTATNPHPTPMMGYTPSNGQMGTGVQVSQIVRMRDSFVDMRLRQQLQNRNYWATLEEGLRQVELFFNEPSENSIHYALDQLWDCLQDLSRDPELMAVREVVVQRAELLVEAIRGTRGQLQRLSENINDNIPTKVDEVNILAQRLADLNDEIGKVSATGSLPNDLLDARDAILEQLSSLVNIEITEDHANMVGVTIGGTTLVHRSTAYKLNVRDQISTGSSTYSRKEIYWESTKGTADITSGEIGGMLHLRDDLLQDSIDKLDEWTRDFVAAFNSIHAQGFDLEGNGGEDPNASGFPQFKFFTFDLPDPNLDPVPSAAMNIRVNAEIIEDVSRIRASSLGGARGNGENALRLASLRHDPPEGSTSTIGDDYNAIISSIGVKTQEAIRMTENQVVLENHLLNLKESISGVSLDEEMANMIRFQHAYNAAARMMTAVDETLDVIINRLGIVGR